MSDQTLTRLIRFKSSDSGEVYHLQVYPTGEIACNCNDFTYRRRFGRDECKHITAWKAGNIRPGAADRGRVIDNPALFR